MRRLLGLARGWVEVAGLALGVLKVDVEVRPVRLDEAS